VSKLISRFEIGLDNDAKATINDLKAKIDGLAHELSAKNDTHADRLLAAMQADAANDALQPELKELGQWVFEGQDEKWVSAAKDADNEVWLFQVPLKDLATNENKDYSLWYAQDGSKARYLCDLRSSEDWKNSAIDRETVNDVDYLSGNDLDECVPHIDDVLDQSDVLSESVPQITQADMQLIFIKNLSETLIQRMHSMDRFSEDDYAIGGDKLMAWDIVIGNNSFNDKRPNFAIVIATSNIENSDKSSFGIADLNSCFSLNQWNHTGRYVKISVWHNETYRTITEDELPAFRAALEACYA